VERSLILTHWGLDHAEQQPHNSSHACFHPTKDLVVPPDALLPHAAPPAHRRPGPRRQGETTPLRLPHTVPDTNSYC
jgi:hypothetical protein